MQNVNIIATIDYQFIYSVYIYSSKQKSHLLGIDDVMMSYPSWCSSVCYLSFVQKVLIVSPHVITSIKKFLYNQLKLICPTSVQQLHVLRIVEPCTLSDL